MSKELKPLEALEILKEADTIYCGCASNLFARYRYEIETIEKALEDYELLIATSNIIKNNIKDIPEEDITNKLKAFEIIVKKEVNIRFFQKCLERRFGRRFYNNTRGDDYQLTEEEWEILKIAIKGEKV